MRSPDGRPERIRGGERWQRVKDCPTEINGGNRTSKVRGFTCLPMTPMQAIEGVLPMASSEGLLRTASMDA